MLIFIFFSLRALDTQTIETLGSGFAQPNDVFVDRNGFIYVADYSNNAIKKIDQTTGLTSTITNSLNGPATVHVDLDGNIYIADMNNNCIKMISAQTSQSKLVVTGLNRPEGVFLDVDGHLYVADTYNNAVKKYNLALGTFVYIGTGLKNPHGIFVDSKGNTFVADSGNNAIKKITSDGVISLIGSGFRNPQDVFVDSAGNIWIADTDNNAVKKVSSDGVITVIGYGFRYPSGICVDDYDNVYIANWGDNTIKKISFSQKTTTSTYSGKIRSSASVFITNHSNLSITPPSEFDLTTILIFILVLVMIISSFYFLWKWIERRNSNRLKLSEHQNSVKKYRFGAPVSKPAFSSSIHRPVLHSQSRQPTSILNQNLIPLKSYNIMPFNTSPINVDISNLRNPSSSLNNQNTVIQTRENTYYPVSTDQYLFSNGSKDANSNLIVSNPISSNLNTNNVRISDIIQNRETSFSGSTKYQDSNYSHDVSSNCTKVIPQSISFENNTTIMTGENGTVLTVPLYLKVNSSSYKIGQRIAKGGFGEIFHIMDNSDLVKLYQGRKLVAKKLINSDKVKIDSYFQELSIMCLFIGHPNFAQFIGYDDEAQTIILEFYPEGSVVTWISKRSQCLMEHLISLVIGTSRAVNEMHIRGLVHNDLKLDNILVQLDNNGCPIPKLTDFGMTNVVDATLLKVSGYRVSNLRGTTKQYCGPDRFIAKFPNVSPIRAKLADIYSFSMVIYAMLNRREPWA